MKKVLLSLLLAIMALYCHAQKVIDHPWYQARGSRGIDITKIELDDEKTVLHFWCFYGKGKSITVQDSSFL